MNFEGGHISSLPVCIPSLQTKYYQITENCIYVSKVDWDSYETSWDFQRHPLLQYFFSIHPAVSTGTERPLYEISKDIGPDHHIEISQGYPTHAKIRASYEAWRDACEQRFQQLKANEEQLNRIFIDIYGLQDELTPEVADKDVTVHRVFDTKEDVPESMQGSAYVRTKRDEVVHAFEQLKKAEANILGVILNGCETETSEYYYAYYTKDGKRVKKGHSGGHSAGAGDAAPDADFAVDAPMPAQRGRGRQGIN